MLFLYKISPQKVIYAKDAEKLKVIKTIQKFLMF